MAKTDKPEKLTEDRLRAILKNEVEQASGYLGDELQEDRAEALDYYMGEPFGNEVDGQSQVVMTEVQDAIESIMPSLIEIFAGGDTIAKFQPTTRQDEEFSEQATDYAQHIWWNDNDGFGVTHDWIKDALIQKNGFIKVYWNEADKVTRETRTNLNSLSLQQLVMSPEVEVIEHTERDASLDELQSAPDGKLHDVTIKRTRTDGRVRVEAIPPEEILITRDARSLREVDHRFVCHRKEVSISDLLEEGYSWEDLEDVPSGDPAELSQERIARYMTSRQDVLNPDSLDATMRTVWRYESYIKVDYDGDGIAELRNIVSVGPAHKILYNEALDDHPIVSLTPIRMSHRLIGRAVTDLLKDLQLIASTVMRQLLDNMYRVNNARAAINDRVDIDDYLTNRPGGAVRVEGRDAVGDAIQPIITQPLGSIVKPLLEELRGIKEARIGVTRYNQGIDADSLNKTATGINLLLGAAQKRLLLIARVFAETGFKEAFRKILKLIVEHQDAPRTIRLRNKWVDMDPRSWNSEMDVSIAVGLGYGTKEQEAQGIQMVLMLLEKIVMLQGGVDGPLITLKNIHHASEKAIQAAGFKDAEPFLTEPDENAAPRQPKQDPAIVQAQMMAEIEREKVQGQLQIQQAKTQADIKAKQMELSMKHRMEMQKMQMEAQKAGIMIDFEKMKLDHQMEMDQSRLESETQRSAFEAASGARLKEKQIDAQAEAAMVSAKSKSNGKTKEK